MDYSAANNQLWEMLLQICIIAIVIIIANIFRRKVSFIKNCRSISCGSFLFTFIAVFDKIILLRTI